MATLSNNLLDVFYMFIGLCMAITMVFTLKDKNHKTRIGTALFWGILAFIFIFARILPSVLVGCLVIVIAILSATRYNFHRNESSKIRFKNICSSFINSCNSNACCFIYRVSWNCSYRYSIYTFFIISICNN